MGRIKTKRIKRISHKLAREHGEKFGTDFDGNKKSVLSVVDISSKKLRNIIAGYLVRLKRSKEVSS